MNTLADNAAERATAPLSCGCCDAVIICLVLEERLCFHILRLLFRVFHKILTAPHLKVWGFFIPLPTRCGCGSDGNGMADFVVLARHCFAYKCCVEASIWLVLKLPLCSYDLRFILNRSSQYSLRPRTPQCGVFFNEITRAARDQSHPKSPLPAPLTTTA